MDVREIVGTAISTPLNSDVDIINDTVFYAFPDEVFEFRCIDSSGVCLKCFALHARVFKFDYKSILAVTSTQWGLYRPPDANLSFSKGLYNGTLLCIEFLRCFRLPSLQKALILVLERFP